MKRPLNIICIGAHPDDCEISLGCSASHWVNLGHNVHFVSVTDGRSGHQNMAETELITLRAQETRQASGLYGISTEILGAKDGELEPTIHWRHEVVRCVRRFQADVVITNRPNDYHPDHRYTAQLVMDASFLFVVPKIAADTPALKRNPTVLFWWDAFTKPALFDPCIAINCDPLVEVKLTMLHEHQTQFYDWIPYLHGDETYQSIPEKTNTTKRKEWLHNFMRQEHPRFNNAEKLRDALSKRYGANKAQEISDAEAFEFCELGSPFTKELEEQLFYGL